MNSEQIAQDAQRFRIFKMYQEDNVQWLDRYDDASEIWDELIKLKLSKAVELNLQNVSKDQVVKLREIAKDLAYLNKVVIIVWDKLNVIKELCCALTEMPKITHFQFFCEEKVPQVFQIIESYPKVMPLLKSLNYAPKLPLPFLRKILRNEHKIEKWRIDIQPFMVSRPKCNQSNELFMTAIKSEARRLEQLYHLDISILPQCTCVLEWASMQKQIR